MLNLSVRALAEFVHRRGDLHARLDGRARAEEGIDTQRRLQRDIGGSYQRERAVSLEVTLADVAVTLAGRIDGCDAGGETILLEEYKTTRADPERAHAHHASVHWAQLMLYAGLLGRELGDGRSLHLRLIYAHPDSFESQRFERSVGAGQATTFLDETLSTYAGWLARQRRHERARDGVLADLAFPYPDFRPFQRAMARRVFRALREREHLLLEAPTGSGKTAATLYPALRALEASGYRRVLFLTSRSTGALAARDAAARMDPGRRFLRHATITARDKACPVPGTPCEPEACPNARGYYDRSRAAVLELLETHAADPDAIAEVARRHRVCPFELSLDTAQWCDLVIADYNYVFDPVVRLQRFAADPDAALLVDETHQLAPRVRDMLSLSIERREVRAALTEPLPEALARRVRSIDRALVRFRSEQALADERVVPRPDALLRSMQRFVDDLATAEHPLEALPETRALLFACSRWLRSEAWYHPDRFRHLGAANGRQVRVRLLCVDPGAYIRERFDAYGGHVRFSGTVSPLDLYAQLHGEPGAPRERAGNPFGVEQLKVLVVDDVPTTLRRRAAGVPALVALIETVADARPGHYLVALPSFDYLNLAAEAFARAHPSRSTVSQRPGMDDAARGAFLDAFDAGHAPCVGFVVLGGIFGESVDFARARLAGVICVGVGLPPPALERRAIAEYFSGCGADGAAVAYHQPAMVKVLQMAGRLLRDPADRGVLCLVDARFRERAYRRFFPAHWQPQVTRTAEVADALAGFWQGIAPE